MTYFRCDIRFDKDVDINLKLLPNEIHDKCIRLITVDDSCICKRSGEDSPHVLSNDDISVDFIFKLKENEGTFVTKNNLENKFYNEFGRENIVNIEFLELK